MENRDKVFLRPIWCKKAQEVHNHWIMKKDYREHEKRVYYIVSCAKCETKYTTGKQGELKIKEFTCVHVRSAKPRDWLSLKNNLFY